jgi:hypothetical protein
MFLKSENNNEMKKLLLQILFVFTLLNINAQQINLMGDSLTFSKHDFILAEGKFVADILLDKGDNKTVQLAAGLFSDDVKRVTAQKPEIKFDIKTVSNTCVIVGSIEESRIIKDLVKRKVIDVSDVKGKWESCLIQVVENPAKGINKALVIAGSDRRGTAYGLLELSRQMGVSPWYYFADVPVVMHDKIVINQGRFVQKPPSVQYRGIFINDEMWGIRPWAMNTLAPEEGKGLGPTTYSRIFELLLRLKANMLWPAMHQQTKPFNYYPENSILADKYGIVMGSSHIEPMLRNNIAGAEWDQEYPGEPYDYVVNRKNIYKYWEDRVKQNGKFENIYTIGKRGKDDEAGTEVTVNVLEKIFADQQEIFRKWVNKYVSEVPQVLIPYTEVLDLYNKGLKVPDEVIVCWPDDNFGYIRQLPDKEEQKRPGGSGVYYHFQWLNGATTAYPWLYSSPLALTWLEMKKAWDFNARKLWIVNVGDIKPSELGIEHFMQMAWDMDEFEKNEPEKFLVKWASGKFGEKYSKQVASIFAKYFELCYARRPEHMVMFNARENALKWDWFSLYNYNDEVQKRIDEFRLLIEQVDEIYEELPLQYKDAFFQMVAYNVKGAAFHNLKVLYAQKSNIYGNEKRASAATYAAFAQQAENEIHNLIHHYNREQVLVGSKWDRMASLPGPWGSQWRQWDMPPLSNYSGEGVPEMQLSPEGEKKDELPGFSVFNNDKRFIDIYNSGNGLFYWKAEVADDWIELSESAGSVFNEKRIWVSIEWEQAPKGADIEGSISFSYQTSNDEVWRSWENLTGDDKKAYIDGTLKSTGSQKKFEIGFSVFNPDKPSVGNVSGFVESNGYISIEAEHFTRKTDGKNGSWNVIEGLGRTGNSVAVLPFNTPSCNTVSEILNKSPSLEYEIVALTTGEVSLELNCIPTYPANKEYGLRFAVSVNDDKPVIVSDNGKRDVISNLLKKSAKLNIPGQGQYVLKIWMVDPGLVIDKIIINTGGVKDSYLGPPESVYKN